MTLQLATMYCAVSGSLARLYLNRPEVHNAANWAWVKDLVTVTDYLQRQPDVQVVIVSGKGRSFCSGLDTKELAHGNLPLEWFDTWERGMTALSALNAISIASIHGYCLGGGLQLALACDLRIAAEDAVLSIPAVREGVVAALGPMRLARLIGSSQAKWLCLLGRRFSATEGQRLGIIHEVAPPEKLEEQTNALAEELLSLPFTALHHTKRQIDLAFENDIATLTEEFLQAQQECLQSPEHAELMAEYRAREAFRKK
ncbi:hypothetical protein KTH_05020 [Thermosporothrix hazakensis]|nr:hypothetical protein KTC_06910 [Thermosporothrix sp. COM3]GCE45633.1 hypothetical protein KTH_05020 [Thermosporothrix hazakensis]